MLLICERYPLQHDNQTRLCCQTLAILAGMEALEAGRPKQYGAPSALTSNQRSGKELQDCRISSRTRPRTRLAILEAKHQDSD
jgi:hypothetical protein